MAGLRRAGNAGSNTADELSAIAGHLGHAPPGHKAAITTTSGQITKYAQTGDAGIGTRQVTYGYPSAGAQLQTITEPTGQVITFGYTGTDLTAITVTAPGGAQEKPPWPTPGGTGSRRSTGS